MTITAQPLTWPHGWKRIQPGLRKTAKFSRGSREYSSQPGGGSWLRQRPVTIDEGTTRVLAELSRMGVQRSDVIISTNLELRLDGLPRSNQRAPSDPGVAVYWRHRKVDKVMAIDIYDTVADNLAAVAATLEAMRAIERHGGAAILDRAFTGFTALPSPETAGAAHWRKVLDCESATTLADVQMAYRRAAAKAHPDREGGSTEAFNLVQTAWAMAQQELRA